MNNKNFYWAEINIPKIDLILDELKQKFLPDFVNKNFGFNYIEDCNLFDCFYTFNFFQMYDLKLRSVAIINLKPNINQNIHIDWNEYVSLDLLDNYSQKTLTNFDESITYALNFNLLNCETSITEMFKPINNNRRLKYNSNNLPYYSFSSDEVERVTTFSLKKGILINVGAPHQVKNNQDKQRTCISFRFNKIELSKLPIGQAYYF